MVYSYGRALTPRCSRTEPDEEDVTALELEVKGVCEPLSVMLQPYAIHIPGQLMMQTATKRQFRVRLAPTAPPPSSPIETLYSVVIHSCFFRVVEAKIGSLKCVIVTIVSFQMINNSITVILFQWDNVTTQDLILEVEPPLGELRTFTHF